MSESNRFIAPARTSPAETAQLDSSTSPSTVRQRAAHACDRCRLMRTKCSGEGREPCSKCLKDGAECTYSDRKREKARKDLAESHERKTVLEKDITVLASALRELCKDVAISNTLSTETAVLVRRYAARGSVDMAGTHNPFKSSRASSPRPPPGPVNSGEEETAATAGSPRNQGQLKSVVDLGTGKGAVGYIGEMSDISWLQRIREYLVSELDSESPADAPKLQAYDPRTTVAEDLSYFTDEVNLLSVNEDYVDDTAWPSMDVATILAQGCFHALQGAFNFVNSEKFLDTLKNFPHDGRTYSWTQRRWLATANMVWAVGDKWLHDVEFPGLDDGHLTYYARARALGLDHRVLFDHPDFETIQAIGLLAFYLFLNGSLTRAWTIVGHAMRHATSVGMHLKVVDPSIDHSDQENRARIFYSLYSLEVLLSEALGRPKSISLEEITAPVEILAQRPEDPYAEQIIDDEVPPQTLRHFWVSFLEQLDNAQGRAGSVFSRSVSRTIGFAIDPEHFPHRIRLCMISHRISLQLYTTPSQISWADFQTRTQELEKDLDEWHQLLPADLDIRNIAATNFDPRPRLELAMYFLSIRMIIYRPFLCVVHVDHASERSKKITTDSAQACVTAAMDLLSLLPADPTKFVPFHCLPWWSLLHHLCQAGAVLILELCLGARHVRAGQTAVFKHVQKVIAYLETLAGSSLSAYKAWRVLWQMSAWVVERFSTDAVPMLTQQPQMGLPTNWTPLDEAAIARAFRFDQADDSDLTDTVMSTEL